MLRMIPVVRAGCASNAGGASFTFVTGAMICAPRGARWGLTHGEGGEPYGRGRGDPERGQGKARPGT